MSGPTFSRYAAQENDLVLDKLQLVMKWGGESTHSARYQCQELGQAFREDFKLLNKRVSLLQTPMPSSAIAFVLKLGIFRASSRKLTRCPQ